jgi:predicted RNA-binding protein with RPS1 domain
MSQEIEFKKTVIKKNAPLIYQMSVDKNQAKMIIGNRGDTIKTLCEVSGARIDVDSATGIVSIFANNKEIIDRAVQMIKDLILQAEVGKVYEDGIVEKITDFGIFVRFLSDKMLGLLHEKNCDNDRYAFLNLKRSVRIGCKIKVRVMFISADGKIGLSPVFEDKQENDNNDTNKGATAVSTNASQVHDSQSNNQESRTSSRLIRPTRQRTTQDVKVENDSRAENSIKDSEVFAEESSKVDNVKTENIIEKKEPRKEEPVKDFKSDPKYNCNFF